MTKDRSHSPELEGHVTNLDYATPIPLPTLQQPPQKAREPPTKTMVTTRVELATLALLAPRSNQLYVLLVVWVVQEVLGNVRAKRPLIGCDDRFANQYLYVLNLLKEERQQYGSVGLKSV